MTYLLDFIKKDDVKDSLIFPYLSCNAHEALILKKILLLYLNGNSGNNDTISFIESTFHATGAQILPYLKEIHHLVQLGFINGNTTETYLDLCDARLQLSSMFLNLLEREMLDLKKDAQQEKSEKYIKNKKYNSVLEYLDDISHLLELMTKNNTNTFIQKNEKLRSLYEKDILLAKDIIAKNLKKSGSFYINELFDKLHLNELARLSILSILKNQIEDNATQVGTILNLAKNNDEKIILQELMSDDGELIKNDIIYFDFFPQQSFADRDVFLTPKIFNKTMQLKTPRKRAVLKNSIDDFVNLKNAVGDNEIFDIIEPKIDFNKIILDDDIKQRLDIVIQHANENVHKKLKKWGIKDNDAIDLKILLYGDSGTGKTMSAEGIAKGLNKTILSLDCSKILSMYVGESEKNVRRIFDEYKEIQDASSLNPILLLDEADQLLSARGDSSNGSARMYNQMQNIFLSQIEKFEGIIIATTNLLENLDSAFSRRFAYKIKFNRPNEMQRKEIWNLHLPHKLKFDIGRDKILNKLCQYDLSGGQIKIVVLNTAYKVALRKNVIFTMDDFISEVEKEIHGDFSTFKKLGFYVK